MGLSYFTLIVILSFLSCFLNDLPLVCSQQFCQKLKEPSIDGCLIQQNECLFMYSEKIILQFSSEDKDQKSPEPVVENIITSQNTTQISQVNGRCFNKESMINGSLRASLNLTFTGLKNISAGSINIQLSSDGDNGYWAIENINFAITTLDENSYQFGVRAKHMSAPMNQFSYSCNRLQFSAKTNKTTKYYHGLITFQRFQLQPFQYNETVFADSFDCSTWFTIPTWMGLITLSVFTFIVSVGIYFLSNIKSPDRFETAKSKPLTIAASD